MIIVSEQEQQRYREAGLWSDDPATHSLDGLLRANAHKNPDAPALIDAPDRPVWTGGQARAVNWAQLNHHVDLMASFLQGLDLPEESVIALYGPNTVDLAVSILAIHRARFIAAPLPLFWRKVEMLDYLGEIQARALITVDRVEEDQPALRCRDIAQNLFSLKYVLGFGDYLPDGVVDLSEIIASLADEQPSHAMNFPALDPDALATLHPTGLQSRDTEIVLPRSSNQWIAAHRALMQEARPASVTLSPFALSGLAGFCGGLVHALKTAGCLHFHHYQTDKALAGHIDLIKPERVFLPKTMVRRQSLALTRRYPLEIACVWKNDHLISAQDATIDFDALFDITILNEIAAIGSPRTMGSPMPRPLLLSDMLADQALKLRGPHTGRVKQQRMAGGELIATGAAIPVALFPSNSERRAFARLRNRQNLEGALTHIACRLHDDDPSKGEPIGYFIDTVAHASQVSPASELDELYQSVPNVLDAAHFIDPKTGTLNVALVGISANVPSREDFQQSLIEMGVSYVKIPQGVYRTSEIRRGVGNVVMRNELVSLIEQNDIKARALQRQHAIS